MGAKSSSRKHVVVDAAAPPDSCCTATSDFQQLPFWEDLDISEYSMAIGPNGLADISRGFAMRLAETSRDTWHRQTTAPVPEPWTREMVLCCTLLVREKKKTSASPCLSTPVQNADALGLGEVVSFCIKEIAAIIRACGARYTYTMLCSSRRGVLVTHLRCRGRSHDSTDLQRCRHTVSLLLLHPLPCVRTLADPPVKNGISNSTMVGVIPIVVLRTRRRGRRSVYCWMRLRIWKPRSDRWNRPAESRNFTRGKTSYP